MSGSPLPSRLLSAGLLGVLALALALGLAPNLDTRLVQAGEALWPGYALQLRTDPAPPDCDPAAIGADLERCTSQAPSGGDSPFGGADPFASDPFASAPSPSGTSCDALAQLQSRCQQRHAEHQAIGARITAPVRAFRAMEGAVAWLARLPVGSLLLSLVLLLGAGAATLERSHIALRRPAHPWEDRASEGAQLLANGFLAASALADQGLQGQALGLSTLWAGGFGAMAVLNAIRLVRPSPPSGDGQRARIAGLLLCPPLYAWLTLASATWFFGVERHPSGLAIYLHQFVQYPSIYLAVGLFVLSGMMFSVTRLARLGFEVLKPLGLPPPLLCWLTGVLGAVPTAWSGASGIFVLAAGRDIYDTLRRAGAPAPMAWAATAMSGSLGVVLRPCLLVVLVAALNKQVTTDALYDGGLKVFATTVALYGVAMLLRIPGSPPAPPRHLGQAGGALVPLLAPLALGAGILAVAGVGLGAWLNEFTAPYLVPLVLVALVAWESRCSVRDGSSPRFLPDLGLRLLRASTSSTSNVGALLLLMSASIALGGVIERAEWVSLFPEVGGPVATMALLVAALVLIGMFMDPMGAVVLVSLTLAGVADRAGIDPIHFWCVVLVAFELGYLTPPVALNQLLTRQVVGAGALSEAPTSPWGRYEHVLVPVAILGTSLLAVAFGPLVLGS